MPKYEYDLWGTNPSAGGHDFKFEDALLCTPETDLEKVKEQIRQGYIRPEWITRIDVRAIPADRAKLHRPEARDDLPTGTGEGRGRNVMDAIKEIARMAGYTS